MGLLGLLHKKKSLLESGLLSGSHDCHSHILYGVDDGVRTLQESLEALSIVESAGVSELWCTPHVMEDIPNSTAHLQSRFSELQEAYKGPVRLHLAAEYMLDTEFEKRLEAEDLLTLKDNVILVETSLNMPPYNLLEMLENIFSKGFRPMLAHPERNTYMSMSDYSHLHDMGVMLQLNLGSVVGFYGETAMKKSWKILKEGWYNAAGSDCHHPRIIQRQYNKQMLQKEVTYNLEKLIRTSSK